MGAHVCLGAPEYALGVVKRCGAPESVGVLDCVLTWQARGRMGTGFGDMCTFPGQGWRPAPAFCQLVWASVVLDLRNDSVK